MGHMPTEADLLKAVLKTPDDDSPRLIYADWLDENGQSERAEFIRIGCRIAECDQFLEEWTSDEYSHAAADDVSDERTTLRRRERELLDARQKRPDWSDAGSNAGSNEFRWSGSRLFVTALIGGARPPLGWRRGFVESISCRWNDWRDYADAILAAQPVTRVSLTTWPEVEWNTPLNGHVECALRGRGHWYGWTQIGNVGESAAVALLRYEWPGIDFALPAAEDYQNIQDQMHDAIIGSLGIPPHLVR